MKSNVTGRPARIGIYFVSRQNVIGRVMACYGSGHLTCHPYQCPPADPKIRIYFVSRHSVIGRVTECYGD
jgi:hypothetical protein